MPRGADCTLLPDCAAASCAAARCCDALPPFCASPPLACGGAGAAAAALKTREAAALALEPAIIQPMSKRRRALTLASRLAPSAGGSAPSTACTSVSRKSSDRFSPTNLPSASADDGSDATYAATSSAAPLPPPHTVRSPRSKDEKVVGGGTLGFTFSATRRAVSIAWSRLTLPFGAPPAAPPPVDTPPADPPPADPPPPARRRQPCDPQGLRWRWRRRRRSAPGRWRRAWEPPPRRGAPRRAAARGRGRPG
mmetsp:Transcript_1859/g.5608  ORF Transcript_1859/g.5608 Transcript_1859/m.5608 type:complete len:252 (+) Transcript_1859:470-1225(+)